MSDYHVCVVKLAGGEGWGCVFTGYGRDYGPPGSGMVVDSTQTGAEERMTMGWRAPLGTPPVAPTCHGEHHAPTTRTNGTARRCERTDCPIRYEAPQ